MVRANYDSQGAFQSWHQQRKAQKSGKSTAGNYSAVFFSGGSSLVHYSGTLGQITGSYTKVFFSMPLPTSTLPHLFLKT